jgi:predicted porin
MKINVCRTLMIAAAVWSATASAQNNATIYGIYDTGVEYVTNADAAGGSVVRMPSLTGSVPSRLGFKGEEKLDGDLKAVFVLEAGFTPDTGMLGQGGRLFGRQAYVGLKNSAGTLMLGRQYTMLGQVTATAGTIGPNIHGLGSLDSYIPNARHDNSIGYLGKFSNFTVGATYSFGRDTATTGGPAASNCAGEVAGDARACRHVSAALGYDTPQFGISAAYENMYGNTGARTISGPDNPLTASRYNDRRIALGGYWMFGATKLGVGGISRRTNAARESGTDIHFIGVTVPFAVQWVLDAELSRLKVKNTSDTNTLLAARVTYNFSKRTALYTSLGYVRNSVTVAANAAPVDSGGSNPGALNQAGIMTGIRHTF